MGCQESKLLMNAAVDPSAAEAKGERKGSKLQYRSVPLNGVKNTNLDPVIEADREDTSATEEEDAFGIEMEASVNEYQYYNDEQYDKQGGWSYGSWDSSDDTRVDEDDNTIVRIDKRQKHAFKQHVKRYYHERLYNYKTGEYIDLPPPRLEFPKQRIAI